MSIRKVSTAGPGKRVRKKRGPVSSLWWALALIVILLFGIWLIAKTDFVNAGLSLVFLVAPVVGLVFLIQNHREHIRR